MNKKDIVETPLEPFTTEEEAALMGKLDALSVADLQSYIGSAKGSLGNRALQSTWRGRIELALNRAEASLVRAEYAASQVVAAPPVEAAPAPKSKSKKAAVVDSDE